MNACNRTIPSLKIASTDTCLKALKLYPNNLNQLKKKISAIKPFQVVSIHGKVGTGKSTLLHDIGVPAFPILAHQERIRQSAHSCTNGILSAPFVFDINRIDETWPLLFARESKEPEWKQMVMKDFQNCGMLYWDIEGQGHRLDPELDEILNAFVALCSSLLVLNCKYFGMGDIVHELDNISKFASAVNSSNNALKLGTVVILQRDYQATGPLDDLAEQLKEKIKMNAKYNHLLNLFDDIKVFGLPQRIQRWTDEEARNDAEYGGSLQAFVFYLLESLRESAISNPNRVYGVNKLQDLLQNYDGFDQQKVELLWKEVTVDLETERRIKEERKAFEEEQTKQRKRNERLLYQMKKEKEEAENKSEKEKKENEERWQAKWDSEFRQSQKRMEEDRQQTSNRQWWVDWANVASNVVGMGINAYTAYNKPKSNWKQFTNWINKK